MATKNTGSYGKGSQANRPNTRQTSRASKKPRKPVTIDLEASKVVSKPTASPLTETTGKSSENSSDSVASKPAIKSAVPSVKATASKPAPTVEKTADTEKTAVKKPTGAAKPEASKTSSAPAPAAESDIKSKTNPNQNSGADKKAPPPVAKNEKSSGSSLGKLSAGIIGGAVALTGAYLLQQTGMISTGASENTEFKSEITRIDETLNSLSSNQSAASSPDLSALIARISELEASQKAISGKLDVQGKEIDTVGATASNLATSVEQAVKTSNSLQQSISSGSAGENAALSTLDERLKAVEANTSTSSNTSSDDIEALKAQLDELATKLAAIAPADNSKLDGLLNEATANIAALSAKITEVAQSAGEAQTATGEKITSIEGSIGEVQQNLTGLGARLDGVEKIATTPQKDEQRVARALAVAGLKSAIDSGGNFEAALALVESLSPDLEATAALKPFATSGVPGNSTLEAEFASLSDKIIATDKPTENKSAVSKLFANMRSLVKIKATGAIAGNTPLAIVSRIEDGLKKSDLEAVIREWELLPEAAKALSGDWIKSVKARKMANKLIDNLLNKFITGASGAGN